MRFLAIALLVIFATVFVFWGIGSWSCDQPPKPNSETQQADNSKHDNCATPYGTVIVGLHDTGDFVHIFHEEIIAISTFFIAIFTIILGVFTVVLAGATKLAAEHIPRVERAYVHGGPGKASMLKTTAPTLRVMITVNNFGKTPAFVKDICWDVYDDGAFRSPDFTKNRKYLDMFIRDGVVYETPVIIDFTAPSLLYLLIRYEDMFGGSHETGLTYRIFPRAQGYNEPVEGIGSYRKWT